MNLLNIPKLKIIFDNKNININKQLINNYISSLDILNKKKLILLLLEYNLNEINENIIIVLKKINIKLIIDGNLNKAILFGSINNILHLVVFNNLSIDILLTTLLLYYYLKETEIENTFVLNSWITIKKNNYIDIKEINGQYCGYGYIICYDIVNYSDYKFDIIEFNFNHNYIELLNLCEDSYYGEIYSQRNSKLLDKIINLETKIDNQQIINNELNKKINGLQNFIYELFVYLINIKRFKIE